MFKRGYKINHLKLNIYEIVPTETYKIVRNCSGCGCKSIYYNTNKFRVNSNGNKIDIWLIYQCIQCKHTYNLSIYERVKIDQIPVDEYSRFLSNDSDIALKYGLDKSIMTKNKVMINWKDISYDIKSKTTNTNIMEYTMLIKNSYGLNIRIDKIISEILNVSRSKIKEMIKDGYIVFEQYPLKYITKVEII